MTVDLVKDKFGNFYINESYNNNGMNVVINDIDQLIESNCNCGGLCVNSTHSIGAKQVGR